MLILLGFSQGAVGFFQVFQLLWYQGLLTVLVIVSFFIPFGDIYIKKNPWNWEHACAESDINKD